MHSTILKNHWKKNHNFGGYCPFVSWHMYRVIKTTLYILVPREFPSQSCETYKKNLYLEAIPAIKPRSKSHLLDLSAVFLFTTIRSKFQSGREKKLISHSFALLSLRTVDSLANVRHHKDKPSYPRPARKICEEKEEKRPPVLLRCFLRLQFPLGMWKRKRTPGVFHLFLQICRNMLFLWIQTEPLCFGQMSFYNPLPR